MTAPQKLDVSTYTTHSARIKLDSGDIRMRPDYKGGEFRPTSLRLEWTLAESGGWELLSLTIRGPMLKKDGTDSMNEGKQSFYAAARILDNLPDWVRALVEAHTPTVVGR